MYQPTLRDVTYQGYPIQYSSAVSSEIEEIDKNDIWDNLLSTLIREKRFRKPSLYHNLIFLLENDWSSVWPRFGIKNETSLIGELSKEKISKGISEENIAIEMLEHDFVVKMSPRRRYKVHVLVRSRRKGEPRAVEFDNDLLTE
ncbi:MAG: hypothetical protein DRP41_01605 [Thermodesulfobacteriota bacterium]|nr:MAG: hypothetical protein DRP41_01605 [Thermodesulfobacteriota bacterium]